MRKRRKILILLAAAFVAGILAWVFCRRKEPAYGGRSLKEWVMVFRGPGMFTDERFQAEAAIRSMGPEALPFLVDWLEYEPPRAWRFNLANSLRRGTRSSLRLRLAEVLDHSGRFQRSLGATHALYALGTNGLPAMPRLVRLMNDPSARETAKRAATALSFLGTNGLPAMLDYLAHPRSHCQRTVIQAIGTMRDEYGAQLDPALPVLVKSLRDPEAAASATLAIGRFKPTSPEVIFAMTNILLTGDIQLRRNCAFALGRIESPLALPALTNLFEDPELSVRAAVTNAVDEITIAHEVDHPAP